MSLDHLSILQTAVKYLLEYLMLSRGRERRSVENFKFSMAPLIEDVKNKKKSFQDFQNFKGSPFYFNSIRTHRE